MSTTTDRLDKIRKFSKVGGYCTTRTLADFMGVSLDLVRDLCYEDKLRWVPLPGRKRRELLIERESVIEMFEADGEATEATTATRAGRDS